MSKLATSMNMYERAFDQPTNKRIKRVINRIRRQFREHNKRLNAGMIWRPAMQREIVQAVYRANQHAQQRKQSR